ncbi:uncharacterized metal-dependent hydrolase YabD-like [Mytilus trossulus]|uniref:uncharacterized metal-dependent hydrolase YabD-like n=1 Tax=Mytilus trossulus TaxID=6551 RepID=UPI003007D371
MIEVHSSDDVGCNYTEEQYEQKWVELVNGYLKQISNAFGFKEVTQACDYIWLEDLEGLLDSKKVVAVGECGLDITGRPSSKDFEKQKDILGKQAKIAQQKRLPVVIHCRGNYDTSNECLRCLTDNLPADHHIHRHCFNGSYAEYIKWKIAFPEVKFGISPFLLNEIKYPQFRVLVCKMELRDLLLETDAPYLPGADGSTGSPLLVKDLAEKIANPHNVSTEEVARITTDNAKKLYKIKEL